MSITIPADLLPADGRFGCGPSKVRPEALAALAGDGAAVLGTSHRQAPVKNLVRRVREGLAALFALPDGYEVVLGNGGTTAFWDAAAFGLIRRAQRSTCTFGEFSAKFAAVAAEAPFLGDPVDRHGRPRLAGAAHAPRPASTSTPGRTTRPRPASMAPVRRPAGADDDALVARRRHLAAPAACRSTSAQADVYYFAPQKVLRLRRRPVARAAVARPRWPGSPRSRPSGRWIPEFLDLRSRSTTRGKDQTYNTPALATLFLLADQIDWMLGHGGLDWRRERTARLVQPALRLGRGSRRTPRRSSPTPSCARRSSAPSTSPTSVDAAAVAKTLRANGIVDTEPYRKLGRNQLRIGMFPAVEPDDVTRADRLHRPRGRAPLT